MRNLLCVLPPLWPQMPPIGLGYLQAHLFSHGISADILDLNILFYNLSPRELKKSWFRNSREFQEQQIFPLIKERYQLQLRQAIDQVCAYDCAGFSCFKSNLAVTLEFLKLLKAQKPQIRLILGGPEIARLSFQEDKTSFNSLREFADLIVIGEGESALYSYLSAGRQAKRSVARFVELPDLCALTYPNYRGIKFSAYAKSDALPVQFSRGCIRRCSFCSERLLFKGMRMRTVDQLIEEISYHREYNAIISLVFFDSLFNADLKILESVCDALIVNFGSIPWEAQIAVRDDMSQGLLLKMKQSGCYNLFIGLESGSDNTLKRMQKGFTTAQAGLFFRKLTQTGLAFGVSLIVGFPGETHEDFKASLEFILKNKSWIPKIEQINPFTYYEGSAADKNGDYRRNPEALERMDIFTRQIKEHGFKYTNYFIGNLIDAQYGGLNERA